MKTTMKTKTIKSSTPYRLTIRRPKVWLQAKQPTQDKSILPIAA